MKRTLSLRAMLIGLFVAAVLGAVVLSATGLLSNQRLIEAQRFIIGEALPQQEASREMVGVMAEFGQRHADLLAAGDVASMREADSRESLDERFQAAREDLLAHVEPAQLQRLDAGYAVMLEADAMLESVRQENLRLGTAMAGQVAAMQRFTSEVMDNAETMAERVTQVEQRDQQALYEQIDAWKEDGITTLPTALLDSLFDERDNIAQISYDVRTTAALLAGLARQLVLEESSDTLAELRRTAIAQQFSLARESLETIAGSLRVTTEQSEMAASLHNIVDELEGVMIEGGESVYRLRHQQLELQQTQQQALSRMTEAMRELRATLVELEASTSARADQAAAQAEALAGTGRTLLIGVTLVVALLLAIFGWRTLVRVLGPLAQMRQQMESIGGRGGEITDKSADLSQRLKLERDDEIGRTAEAFNRMMDTFEEIIAQIRNGAESIAASSRQIATGNEDLSQRTEQQSSSLAETASSLEQITATVRQTADYALQARDASQAVDQRAHSAGEVAGRTTDAMQAIRQSSEKITSIITAIDDIAFQTNLLALNASVEAARAGEQGRGFAVVAQEVRKLASRSAEEASQIRRLVDDSVTKVGEGANLVSATSAHLQEIIDSLKQVRDYVMEIADATHEQSAGIEQINLAIAQLDQVTHQNAHLVQEASSASHMLDRQAADMHALVGRFQVAGKAVSAALPGPRPQNRLIR